MLDLDAPIDFISKDRLGRKENNQCRPQVLDKTVCEYELSTTGK